MQRWFVLPMILAAALTVSLTCDVTKMAAAAEKKAVSTEKAKDAPKEPAKDAAKEPAKDAAKEPAKDAVKPAEAKAAPKLGKELVKNGSFENWKDGKPSDWVTAEVSGKVFKPASVSKSSDAAAGTASAQIPKGAKESDCVILKQDLPAEGVQLGKTVHYSARIKASSANQAQVVLAFKKKVGEGRAARQTHTGSGKWEKLEESFIVPKDARPDSFIVTIYHRGQGKGDVLVDDVSVRFDE